MSNAENWVWMPLPKNRISLRQKTSSIISTECFTRLRIARNIKEFLKVDFPRIPYPKNADDFEHFRHYGNMLRELHLMYNVHESPVKYDNLGYDIVEYLHPVWNKDDGCSLSVWINDAQCFENIPADAWDFYIGGYQPAQKWLKDRKGRTLSFDDIEHYRKIISVLAETKAIMDKIG